MAGNEEIIRKTEEYALHVYNRFPIAIERGEGTRVWDADGNEYLDFMAGIAVHGLGYHYPGYDEALIEQVKKVLHTSNLYYHEPLADASEKVVRSTGLSKVFFTNSGAEAIEGAVKAAKKYAFLKDGRSDHEIIAMHSSFHGRTIGALSVTGNAHYQEPFLPLMDGVRFASFNDADSVEALVNDRTCAILFETVQGEGGVYPATQEFMDKMAALCAEKDILLILDEIQCGMGRTGSMWAYEAYGVKPDIVTSAKALGCGVPVGCFAVSEKVASKSLVAGDHGTTYGGNPFALAAVRTVFDLFEADDIPGHVRKASAYLSAKLDELAEKHPGSIKEHRGAGLLRGLELTDSCPVGEVTKAAMREGLLIISAGSNVLRFVPPLIIGEKEIDEAAEILDKCFKGLESNS